MLLPGNFDADLVVSVSLAGFLLLFGVGDIMYDCSTCLWLYYIAVCVCLCCEIGWLLAVPGTQSSKSAVVV